MQGLISVKPIRGEFLHDEDFFTKMDPYCIIRCGGQQQRTATCKSGGKHPVWYDKFIFQVNNDWDILQIDVFDEDPIHDDYIGVGEMSVAEIKQQGSFAPFAPWIDIFHGHKLKGRVLFELKWDYQPKLESAMQGVMNYPQTTFQQVPQQYVSNVIPMQMSPLIQQSPGYGIPVYTNPSYVNPVYTTPMAYPNPMQQASPYSNTPTYPLPPMYSNQVIYPKVASNYPYPPGLPQVNYPSSTGYPQTIPINPQSGQPNQNQQIPSPYAPIQK